MRGSIEINLNTLKENYKIVKEYSKKEVISVIKSNAYGHGIINVAKTLSSCGCNSFLVATLEEALLLRNNSIKERIIVLENTKNFYSLYRNNLSLSISSIEELLEISSFSLPLKIHLKIETGLNRLGLLPSEIENAINILSKTKHNIEGLYTHIQDEETYDAQEKLFSDIIKKFDISKIKMIHVNSSSYLHHNLQYTTHVRCGLCLYGYSSIIDVHPILSLKAPIYRKKKVLKGEFIGYHKKGIAPENGYIYTIPLGYADGWNNKYITLGYIGEIVEQIGSTCMDQMMFFSTINHQEKEIEIIGNNLPIDLLCKYNFATPYEVLASLSTRLIRKYI